MTNVLLQWLAQDDRFCIQLRNVHAPSNSSAQQVNELEDAQQKLKEERDQAIEPVNEYKAFYDIGWESKRGGDDVNCGVAGGEAVARWSSTDQVWKQDVEQGKRRAPVENV